MIFVANVWHETDDIKLRVKQLALPHRGPGLQVLIESVQAVSHVPSVPSPSPTQSTLVLASQHRSAVIKQNRIHYTQVNSAWPSLRVGKYK